MKEYIFFIRKLLLFIIIFVCVDFCVGAFFDKLLESARYGNFGRLNYIIDKSNDNILIFGSSRAVHHYVPAILQDSLECNCFNCGFDGNGIILMNSLYKMLSERYIPKIIIYDVSSGFDGGVDDNTKYLGWLRPFTKHDCLCGIFDEVAPMEKYKLFSNLYRWNVKFIQVCTDNIKDFKETIQGYKPLYGVMDEITKCEGLKRLKQSVDSLPELESDSLKLKLMEEFIKMCKHNGTMLIFYKSPSYCANDINEDEKIVNLASRYNVPFMNHINEGNIYSDYSKFKDRTHMNNVGAEFYSRIVASEVKNMFK